MRVVTHTMSIVSSNSLSEVDEILWLDYHHLVRRERLTRSGEFAETTYPRINEVMFSFVYDPLYQLESINPIANGLR